MIGTSAREVGWVVRFPREGYTLFAERDRPDGRANCYLFSHNLTGLNVSVRIEPARTCTAAEACRDAYWRDRSPSLATAELLDRSEGNGFASLEFTEKLQAPQLAGRTAKQLHFSGHLVRDGYWVDLHLSMMPYTQSNRQVFLDFLDAIRIEAALTAPVATEVQSDGRTRRWTWVKETGRFLRVITLPDGETVHNAFFDRDFRPR